MKFKKYKQAAIFYFLGTVIAYAIIFSRYWGHIQLFWHKMMWHSIALTIFFLVFCVLIYKGNRRITLLVALMVFLRIGGYIWKIPQDLHTGIATVVTFLVCYGLIRAVWNLPP